MLEASAAKLGESHLDSLPATMQAAKARAQQKQEEVLTLQSSGESIFEKLARKIAQKIQPK